MQSSRNRLAKSVRCQPACQVTSILVFALLTFCCGQVKAALPTDLELVPGDCAGFVHLRPADIWNSETMSDARQLVAKAGPEALAAFDKKLMPPISSIERITIIWPTPPAIADPTPAVDPEAVSALLVIACSKPIDPTQLQKAWMPDGRIKKHLGKSYFFDEESWAGLYLADDRTFVMGSEDALVFLLERMAVKKTAGPLSPVLHAMPKHPIVVALNGVAVGGHPGLKQLMPLKTPALLDAQTAILTADLGKEMQLEIRLNFASDEEAQAGEKAGQAALDLVRILVAQAAANMEAVIQQKPKNKSGLAPLLESAGAVLGLASVRQVEGLLKTATIQRQGTVVRLPINVPASGPSEKYILGSTAIQSLAANSNQAFGFIGESIGVTIGGDPKKIYEEHFRPLGQAMDKYHDKHGHYPPAAILGKDGQPLLSWRVAILPYLGEEALYKQFKLDEPWDSLHNKKMLKKMPKALSAAYAGYAKSWKTTDQVFTGPGTIFEGSKGIRKADITDGLGQTILLILTGDKSAVAWTKPADLVFVPGKPLPQISDFGSNPVLFADGSVRNLTKQNAPEETMRALITRNGGEKVKVPD